MKKLTTIIAAVFITAAFTMSFESCGKYEEGPTFSLKTKKNRLAREWELETLVDGATTVSAPATSSFTIEFTKDGDYIIDFGIVATTGSWEFVNSKEDLLITIDYGFGLESVTTEIIRLTSEELWTRDTDGSEDEQHYKPR